MCASQVSLRFLVVGCGSIGQRHISNLQQLGIKDILVYDPEQDCMEMAISKYDIKSCGRLEDAYAATPDAVLVCAPTSLHLPLTREAILHNCNVFVEKPLSHTLDGVDELIGQVHERRRVLMVGYNLRFNSCACQIKAWLNEERIGQVVSARLHFGSYLPWRHPWEDYRLGYGARRALGGGVILDAIHEIDYALWFFGQPESVYCMSGRFSNLEIDTEDVAELLLSYSDHKVVSIHLDYLQRPHKRWCELIGERGVIHCDFVKGIARLYEGERREWIEFEDRSDLNDEYVREMEHFLECMAGQATPVLDGLSARQSLAVAVVAKLSASEGRPLNLTPYLASGSIVSKVEL
jgi:predicted dehydrogenase